MSTTLISFPCDFSIKVIGKNTPQFAENVLETAKKFYPELSDHALRAQPSKNQNYLALNVTVRALDQATLDALYLALTQLPDIQMVL